MVRRKTVRENCVGVGHRNRLPCWTQTCVSVSGIFRSQWCAHSARVAVKLMDTETGFCVAEIP
jgi:hypothetical protein